MGIDIIIAILFGMVSFGIQGFFPTAETMILITSFIWPLCFLYAICKTESIRRSFLILPAVYIGTFFRYIFTLGRNATGIKTIVAVSALAAVLIFLVLFLYSLAYKKTDNPLITLLLPTLFCAIQLVFSQVIHLGNIVDPAAAVINLKIIAQSAALIGEHGISFIYFFIIAALVFALDDREKRHKIVLISLCAALIIGQTVYGAVRLGNKTEKTETIKVANAISYEADFMGSDLIDYTYEDYFGAFERAIKDATANNADILVTNEEYAFCKDDNYDILIEKVSDLIGTYHIPTVFCVAKYYEADNKIENKALLFDENGQLLCEYDKHNRIFLLETFSVLKGDDVPGEAVVNIKGKPRNVALAICFDLNDEMFINKISNDVEIIIAPSWDWDNVCYSQPRYTRTRAIETGATLIKTTYDGITFAADMYGQIISREYTIGKYDSVTYMEVCPRDSK